MTFLRVVAAVLLLWPSSALAQQKPAPDEAQKKQFSLFPEHPNFPFPDGKAVSPFRFNEPLQFAAASKKLLEDATCYVISSYLVARDEKNSDSTHLVGHSTCQPANRYGLKSAEMQAGAAGLTLAPE